MIFVDSSAFLKRYIEEPGSDLVARVMGEDPRWAASVLARTESEIALRRRLSGTGSRASRANRVKRLDDEWQYVLAVPIDAECLARAQDIGCDLGVRTLDAIHLAAALQVAGRPGFLTFDRRQRDAATELGLAVIAESGGAG